jgi:hypothetical protein
LIKDNVVIEERIKGKRNIKLFVNHSNLLVLVPRQLESFEKNFKQLLDKAKKITDKKYESAITRVSSSEKENDRFSSMKDSAKVISEFASINSQPLYMLFAMTDVYLLQSTAIWPKIIKDRETLKNLYIYVFKKIADMQICLFESLKSTKIGSHGDMSDIIIPYFETRLNMTSRLNRFMDVYAKFDMQKEIERLIDSLWEIQGGLQKRIYPEPSLYGWNFKYGVDNWRKLLKLQKEHPEQTYSKHVNNTIKNSGFSELDWVKNSNYMKREKEREKM